MAKDKVTNFSHSSLIFLASIFLLTISLLFVFRKRTKTKQPSARLLPPGPKPWPFIGHIPELILKKPIYQWLHHLMKDMKTDIACVRFGGVHVIPIVSPKIALEVVRKKDATFASRPPSFAAYMFSIGYKSAALSPSGDQSKKMRNILISEIISPKRHRSFHDKRTAEADYLLHYVYNKAKRSEHVDIRAVARHYCGNLIRNLMFNKRYFVKPMHDGGPGADEIEHVNAIFNSLEYLFAFSISDYFPQLIGLNLDGHETVIKAASETLTKFHDPIIDERVHLWRENEEISVPREPQDFLDILIMLRDKEGRPLLTPGEIKAQSIEIIFAAVDNPSNAVEWILAEMMKNTAILQKAVDEIDCIVGKERLVQEADIPRLNYLKACIREAFRLHPIDPFNLPHVAMEDTTVAGYFIPKGSHVLLSRLGLGRNPDIWHKPLEFKPERHLDGSSELVLAEPDMRFISFSTGRRGCIAQNLGTAMTVMLLARLLQGFSWSKPDGLSEIDLVESDKNLKLAKPLVLQAEPRLPLYMYLPEKRLGLFPQLLGLNLDGHEAIIKAASETFTKFHDPILDERVQLWRENEEIGVLQEPQDFLDILIMLRDREGRPLLTRDEIKAESIDIIFAAVDNPSNAVEWILAEMMKNTAILQKAVDEIDCIVGKERLVQEADIPRLNYLKACIREAFRLHPIDAFNVPHVAMEDTTVAGYFIPKGSHVLLSRLGLGRNPDIWHKPLEFKPERHLDGSSELVLAEPDMRFISFSTGQRGCIAQNLGTAMSVMLLARLLQGFSWSKPNGLSAIDLVESEKNLKLANLLVLQAEPRLQL